MILVDTSVWIDYLREADNDEVAWFRDILDHGYPFGVTSVIYQEVLQGADSKKSFDRLGDYLSTQTFYEPLDAVESHREAARLYFLGRRSGYTIRSTIDCLIARVAVEHDLLLLARDRDFRILSEVEPKLRLYSGPYRSASSASWVHEPETSYDPEPRS